MAIDNDAALAEIDAFILENNSNLARVKAQNPNLYEVVSNTLSFLSKKFGGEELPPIEVSQPEEVEAIEEVPAVEEKEIERREFRVGDVFYHSSIKDKKYQILSLNSANNVEVLSLDTNSVTTYTIGEVNDYFRRGVWVKDKFEPTTAPQLMPYAPKAAPIVSADQERIDEIKSAIEGLKVLADIGDEEAIEEIKLLKKELKTLKSGKK